MNGGVFPMPSGTELALAVIRDNPAVGIVLGALAVFVGFVVIVAVFDWARSARDDRTDQ